MPIPGVLFVPDSGDDYEANHCGVVIRLRGGRAEHIGGNTYDGDGNPAPLPPVGVVDRDDKRGGWWLVPPKMAARYAQARKAEALLERQRAAEIARARKGGA